MELQVRPSAPDLQSRTGPAAWHNKVHTCLCPQSIKTCVASELQFLPMALSRRAASSWVDIEMRGRSSEIPWDVLQPIFLIQSPHPFTAHFSHPSFSSLRSNRTGRDQGPQGVHRPRRRSPRPLHPLLRRRCRSPLQHRRLRLPRLQVLRGHRDAGPGRRYPVAHLLGRVRLLLHHRGLRRLPPVLDPLLLPLQGRLPHLVHGPPDPRRQVPVRFFLKDFLKQNESRIDATMDSAAKNASVIASEAVAAGADLTAAGVSAAAELSKKDATDKKDE